MSDRNRLHVGCGTVYLRGGWVNIDVAGHGVHLASSRPDLVEKFATDEGDYYGRHRDKTADALRDGPVTTESACDAFGDFRRLPCWAGEAEEILARQVFEHLSIEEARAALDECDRALAPGGILRIDVPDHEEALKRYRVTGDEFWKRHVLGPRRGDRGYHLIGYTAESLRALVEEHGFVFVAEEANPHFYPAICHRYEKPGKPLARDYALRGVTIDPAWRCLEIGPGAHPWARADVWLDNQRDVLDRIDTPAERKVLADLDGGDALPFGPKAFDFCYCAHVLEHVKDPVLAARKISMVAKCGVVVMPHAFKDALFLFEEGDHRWWCFPPQWADGPVGFMPVDYGRRSALSDGNAAAALCRAIRTGPNRLEADARALRRWFRQAEPALDVIHAWGGDLKVQEVRW